MADSKPERRCVCNECTHGPGPSAQVKTVDFSTEVFCAIGTIESDGRYAPSNVTPVMRRADEGFTSCRRYQAFLERRAELLADAEPVSKLRRAAMG